MASEQKQPICEFLCTIVCETSGLMGGLALLMRGLCNVKDAPRKKSGHCQTEVPLVPQKIEMSQFHIRETLRSGREERVLQDLISKQRSGQRDATAFVSRRRVCNGPGAQSV